MAGGWAKDGAVQDQIDTDVNDALEKIRKQLPVGDSLPYCEQCRAEIPAARREAIRGVRLCINCQNASEENQVSQKQINRRGSKDSQLR